MPKIKKKSAKPLMQPDEEIRSMARSVTDYYHAYQKQANVVLTLLAVALIAVMAITMVRSGNERKAGLLFAAAYDAYNPGGGGTPNYPLSLQRFQDVTKQFGGTVNGAVAQYYLGNTLVQMNQYDAALKEYEAFTKKYAGETVLLGLVYQRMGYAYLALGRRDDALKAFGQAEAVAGTGAATLELARLYDRMGNSQEAQKKYKELSDKLPATTWALEARAKLPPPDLGQTPKSGAAPK